MSDVKVKVGADTTGLQGGLAAADAKVTAFAGKTTLAGAAVGKLQAGMTTLGAVGSKAMAGLQAAMGPLMVAFGAFMGLKGIADKAGDINDLSQRFGASAESMQRVKSAADQSGTSIETIAKGMNRAEIAAVKAAEGNTELDEAFKKLGLSAETFAGLPMEEKLAAISAGYDENANKAEALAALTDIFGAKIANELIPLFAQGGDAIKEMMDAAKVASSDSIGRIDEVQDRFGEMFNTLTAWAMEGLGFIIDLVDKMSVGIAAAIAFVGNLSGGLDEAKQSYNDTLNAGLDMLEEQKAAREERKNKISAANIEEVRKEADEEQKAKEDAKAAEKADKDKEKEDEKAKRDAEKANKDAQKKAVTDDKAAASEAKKAAMEIINKEMDSAKDKLANLKSSDTSASVDSLRRIGGGFAKSNYEGLSKSELNFNKQLEAAQKQVDYLKSIADAMKEKNESTEGIIS